MLLTPFFSVYWKHLYWLSWGMPNKPLCCQLNNPPEAHNSWCCCSVILLHCLTNYTKVKFVMKSEMYLTNYSWYLCSDQTWCIQTCQFSESKMLCHCLPESLSHSQALGTSGSHISRIRAHRWPKTATCSYHALRHLTLRNTDFSPSA